MATASTLNLGHINMQMRGVLQEELPFLLRTRWQSTCLGWLISLMKQRCG